MFGIDLISAIVGAGIGLIFVTFCVSIILFITNKIHGKYLLPEEESFKLLTDKIEPNISNSLKNLEELIDTTKSAIKEYVDVLEENKNLREEIKQLNKKVYPSQTMFQIDPELMLISDTIYCKRYFYIYNEKEKLTCNVFFGTPWGTRIQIHNNKLVIDNVIYNEGSWEYFEVTKVLSEFFKNIYEDHKNTSEYKDKKIDPIIFREHIKSIRAIRNTENKEINKNK